MSSKVHIPTVDGETFPARNRFDLWPLKQSCVCLCVSTRPCRQGIKQICLISPVFETYMIGHKLVYDKWSRDCVLSTIVCVFCGDLILEHPEDLKSWRVTRTGVTFWTSDHKILIRNHHVLRYTIVGLYWHNVFFRVWITEEVVRPRYLNDPSHRPTLWTNKLADTIGPSNSIPHSCFDSLSSPVAVKLFNLQVTSTSTEPWKKGNVQVPHSTRQGDTKRDPESLANWIHAKRE